MGKLVIFLSILIAATAAVGSMWLYNMSVFAALTIYAAVGAALIIAWVIVLISKDNMSGDPTR